MGSLGGQKGGLGGQGPILLMSPDEGEEGDEVKPDQRGW